MALPSIQLNKEKEDLILAGVTYLVTLVLFSPIIIWIFEQTRESEQLFHSLIILGFAGCFLAYDNQEKLTPYLRHDTQSLYLLTGSFILIALKFALPWPPLILLSFCLAIASLVRFTFGAKASRVATAMLVAFFAFILLVLTMPSVDWYLRSLAGQWSAAFFSMLGQGTNLGVINQELYLMVGGKPFRVAQECNGFGVISASILLTLLLTIYLKIKLFDQLLLLVGAVFFALVSNLVRIFIIVSLAPHVSNYLLMHEIVGALVFYGSLALLWWFIFGFSNKSDKPPSLSEPV